MVDVVVVGGGLAGSIAALTCHSQGATVALAAQRWGATALSCGALEVAFAPGLSAAKGTAATVAAHLQDIVHQRPRHPYSLLGVEASQTHVQAGYALLATALTGSGLDLPPTLGWQQRNALTVSSLGCLLPVAMPMGPHRGWSVASAKPWGVVQIAQDPTFAAQRVCLGACYDAQALGLDAPELQPIVVAMPHMTGHYATPFALAQALDDRQVCGRLGAAIRAQITGRDLGGLILPPVVGLDSFAEARQWLAEDVGLPVVEALGHLPSVPGVRLQRALNTAIARAGIQRVGALQTVVGTGDRLQHGVTRQGAQITGGAFILACGRFVAGGVAWNGPTAQEVLLGLPLVTELGPLQARSPQSVLRESPAEAHPLMTAGIGVNRHLQPLRDEVPAWENLFAAGMVLGGFSARYLLCADGVALATAHMASEQALKAAAGASC